MTNIPFDWSENVSYFDEVLVSDMFDRSKYAKFLTKLLVEKGLCGNYVLNLNSEWGSGKTYFIKRWANELSQYHPVVYIDAWQQDYSGDPLLTVVSSMVEQLKAQACSEAEESVFNVTGKIVSLFKVAAPAMVGTMVKRYSGLELDDLLGTRENDVIVAGEGNKTDMGTVASALVKHLITEHQTKQHGIESLKIAVKQWIGAVKGKNNKQNPAFIFIDELDRCRPSYAVEMLETIKHLFNIPNTVFVVATDTEQLQHAIKVIYGEGFEANRYLGRFFNARYALNRPKYYDYIWSVLPSNFEWDKIFHSIHYDSREQVVDNISTIVKCFNLQAREVAKLIERLNLSLNNMDGAECFNIFYYVILLAMKESLGHSFHYIITRPMKVSGYLSQKWFDELSNVLWSESISLRIKIDGMSSVLSKADFNYLSGRTEDGSVDISLRDFLFYCHSVFQSEGSAINEVSSIFEEVKRSMNHQSNQHMKTFKLNSYAPSYIKIETYSGIEGGLCFTDYLSMVEMTAPFEQLSD